MPEASSSTVSETPGPKRFAAFDRRCPRGRVMLLLTALVLVLNVTTTLRVTQVSSIDEAYWIDHMLRGANFGIERAGVPILQETVREKCERGFQAAPVAPCHAGHLDASEYGYWHGVTIAGTGRPPFYFLITGPIARALRATPLDLSPNDSLITWARLLGSAWLLIGLYFVLRIGELLRVKRWPLVVALVLIAATPALLHADTIVNPDATAFGSGAAVLLAALLWEQRARGLALLGLVALGGGMLAQKNAIGIVLVLAYFGLRALAPRTGSQASSPGGDPDDEPDVQPRDWQDYAIAGGVLVVALLAANFGWDHLYSWIQAHVLTQPAHVADISNNPIARRVSEQAVGFWQLFGPSTVFMMFPPFTDIALPHARSHPLYLTVSKAAEYLAIGAMVAVALREKLRDRVAVLGFATLATLLVSPTLIVVRNEVVGGTYDQPVWRYGLSVLPALAIVIATCARTRFARAGLIVLTGLLYLSALYVVVR